jgi:hypothetical protein
MDFETILQRLEKEIDGPDQEKAHELEDLKKAFSDHLELIPGSLWVFWREEDVWLNFAFFEFYQSDADDKNMIVRCFWRGGGTTGSLRELRHSYIGEDGKGYVFYFNKQRFLRAIEWLSQHFDMDN